MILDQKMCDGWIQLISDKFEKEGHKTGVRLMALKELRQIEKQNIKGWIVHVSLSNPLYLEAITLFLKLGASIYAIKKNTFFMCKEV